MNSPSSPLSVIELTTQLKCCLQAEFSNLWVTGEISDLARPQSGHCYFTLKDGEASISGVMWKSSVGRLEAPLEDGMEVVCQGNLDIYPPRGRYQLIVRRLLPVGEGGLQRALRLLQAKLAEEGLFDTARKRPLPRFPRSIGVVTSPTGAAIRDFLEVARRRWKSARITVIPTRVQGPGAAEEIVTAIDLAGRCRPAFDVIVVTRGGGSMEDLWCFNAESVVRSISRCPVPVVSAVGHEIDVTLSDFVADIRALTPSEAAERILPSTQEVLDSLRHYEGRLGKTLSAQVRQARKRLDDLRGRPVLLRPTERLQFLSQLLDEWSGRGRRAMHFRLERARQRLSGLAAQVDSLSPLSILHRGYAIPIDSSLNTIRSIEAVAPGDAMSVILKDGTIDANVTAIQQKQPFLLNPPGQSSVDGEDE